MIDFSTLKEMEIPEGEVKSILITEADGTAYEVGFGPSTANVKITTPSSTNASFPDIIIDGVNYNDTDIEYELVVPIGTIVELQATSIYVNGIQTNQTTYTIMGDVEIQRSTIVIPPSGPPFTPTVKVGIYIIEL